MPISINSVQDALALRRRRLQSNSSIIQRFDRSRGSLVQTIAKMPKIRGKHFPSDKFRFLIIIEEKMKKDENVLVQTSEFEEQSHRRRLP